MHADVWVMHPAFGVHNAQACDRVTLEELGLPDTATAAQLRTACERWWGGAWPGPPDGTGTLTAGQLAGAILGDVALGGGRGDLTVERVLRAPSIPAAEVVDRVDPRRTRPRPVELR